MTNTRFTYDQDTVTDLRTGLMWQRHTSEDRFNLEAAKKYAANLRLGGYEDWRVPTKDELLSIVDRTRANPAIDTEVFPDTPSHWFWTVSPDAGSSNSAWVVNFRSGNSYAFDVSSVSRVRCVRQPPRD